MRKLLLSFALIGTGWLLAFASRFAIDWIIALGIVRSDIAEKFGQFAMGFIIVVAVIVPFLRLHGVIRSRKRNATPK
ncbi:hypothetical protein [Roseateles sp.]|uniref:hypothetical protein n=1 Tax=Roseateles sp. TaxID=1971397 RepID=UPI0039EB2FAA